MQKLVLISGVVAAAVMVVPGAYAQQQINPEAAASQVAAEPPVLDPAERAALARNDAQVDAERQIAEDAEREAAEAAQAERDAREPAQKPRI